MDRQEDFYIYMYNGSQNFVYGRNKNTLQAAIVYMSMIFK